jgi:FAD/FMN-containing dehydrogenase
MSEAIIPALQPPRAVQRLRGRLVGEALEPGDVDFDRYGGAWNVVHHHRPAVVVLAETVGDVAEAVRFAAMEGLGVGVQSTGHGVTRTADGGVLILTGRLQDLSIDPCTRSARISAGCTWGPVLAAAQVHGLAPLVGSSPTVGAVGYTLGGGLGWLARRHGAAVDLVRSFEVVTPDGDVVRASAHEHLDLFFALRGAGAGSLGIVTSMEIGLVPVGTVYGGNLLYPVEQAAEVFARYADWAPRTPVELTSAVALVNFPPVDAVPARVRGRSFVLLRGCWCGPLDEGRALLDGWRRQVPPALDQWVEMPFGQVGTISNDPAGPVPAVCTGGWLRDLGPQVADALVESTISRDGAPLLAFSEVRHLGGAVAAGASCGTSLGHRDEPFLLNVVGVAPDPRSQVAVAAHQQALMAALAPHRAGTYLNFLEGDARRHGVSDAVDPGQRERLRTVKDEVDPADLMRFGVALQ